MRKRRILFPLMLGACLGLASCAGLAPVLGVATVDELEQKVAAVRDAGSILGPYGDLIATGIAAILVGSNHAYRNRTRRKQLTEVGRFTAAKR